MAIGDYDEFRDTEDVLHQQHKRTTKKEKKLHIPKDGSHRMIFVPSAMMITITESPEASNSASGRIRMAVIRIL